MTFGVLAADVAVQREVFVAPKAECDTTNGTELCYFHLRCTYHSSRLLWPCLYCVFASNVTSTSVQTAPYRQHSLRARQHRASIGRIRKNDAQESKRHKSRVHTIVSRTLTYFAVSHCFHVWIRVKALATIVPRDVESCLPMRSIFCCPAGHDDERAWSGALFDSRAGQAHRA